MVAGRKHTEKKLMAEGVSSDEFRSFPSGHTACAACAMLIGLLPTLRKGKEKRTRLLFILGCLWAAASPSPVSGWARIS